MLGVTLNGYVYCMYCCILNYAVGQEIVFTVLCNEFKYKCQDIPINHISDISFYFQFVLYDKYKIYYSSLSVTEIKKNNFLSSNSCIA